MRRGTPTPLCHDVEHAREAEPSLSQQHGGVKPEIGDFVGQRLVAFLGAGEQDLDGFLADLSEDRRAPAVEQGRGVGPRRALRLPLAERRVELVEDGDPRGKARALTRMARRAGRMNREEGPVGIAAALDALYVQPVSQARAY